MAAPRRSAGCVVGVSLPPRVRSAEGGEGRRNDALRASKVWPHTGGTNSQRKSDRRATCRQPEREEKREETGERRGPSAVGPPTS